jgi:hypothetical protein
MQAGDAQRNLTDCVHAKPVRRTLTLRLRSGEHALGSGGRPPTALRSAQDACRAGQPERGLFPDNLRMHATDLSRRV